MRWKIRKQVEDGMLFRLTDDPGEARLLLQTDQAGFFDRGALPLNRIADVQDGREPATRRILGLEQGEDLAVLLKLDAQRLNQLFDISGHRSLSMKRARP